MIALSRSKFSSVPSREARFAASGSSLGTKLAPALPIQIPLRSGRPSAVRGVVWFPWAVAPAEHRHNATTARAQLRDLCFIASLQRRLSGVGVRGPDRELAAVGKRHVLDEPG